MNNLNINLTTSTIAKLGFGWAFGSKIGLFVADICIAAAKRIINQKDDNSQD